MQNRERNIALILLILLGLGLPAFAAWLVVTLNTAQEAWSMNATVGLTGLLLSAAGLLVFSLWAGNKLMQAWSDQEALARAQAELQEKNLALQAQTQQLQEVLTRTQREAQESRLSAETEIWIATGQAQLAERIRGEQAITTLAGNVIRYLCPYLGAQAGVFFLLENNSLQLIGSYGYKPRPGEKESYALGEGLVGQAAKTGNRLHLKEIPPDAPVIASSLGSTVPKELVLAPLKIERRVVGVLEITTLHGFSPKHFSLLDRCLESIAIAIQTSLAQEHISNLLEKSQQLAQELQVQEEELRAANEELQAQADNMRYVERGKE